MKTGKTTFILIVISIVTKPINFLKEIIIAAIFGAGLARDAFLVAWQIPNIIGSFVFEGLPQIFVPWLTEIRQKENYAEILSSIFNLFALILLVITILVILSSSFLVSIIAPFLSPATEQLAVKLLKIMGFSIFFMGVSAIFTGVIYSYQKFIIPSLTVPLMSLVIIITVILGYSKYGIYSLAYGVLIGSLSMVLLQIFQVKKEKYKPVIIIDNELKKFLTFAGSFFLGTLIFNLTTIAEKIFASALSSGSISYLDYAFRIVQVIFTVFTPVSIVIFSKLCSLSVNPQGEEEFVNLVTKGLKTIMFFVLPIVAVLVALRLPLTEIIYERGAFTKIDTVYTSNLIGIYAFGLIPHSLNFMLIHIFYARKEMIVRIKYSVIFLITFVFFNIIFIDKFAMYGIALANSLSAFICTGFLAVSTIKRIKISLKEILNSFYKLLLVSLIVGLITGKIWDTINLQMNLFSGLLISLTGGASVFFFSVYFLKFPEIKYAKDLIPEIMKKWKK